MKKPILICTIIMILTFCIAFMSSCGTGGSGNSDNRPSSARESLMDSTESNRSESYDDSNESDDVKESDKPSESESNSEAVSEEESESVEFGSRGLEYSVNDDGKTCTLIGIGTCTDSDIYIPEKTDDGYIITSIRYKAFFNCNNLKSVTIPPNVSSIGFAAFGNCKSLETVYLNATDCTIIGGFYKEQIDYRIFLNDINLTNIYIGENVKSIPDTYAIYYSDHSKLNFNDYDNALYLGNTENPYILLAKAKDTTIVSCNINNNTKFIGREAFAYCDNITSITIPDSVISIGCGAFGCTGVATVKIGSGVTYIGQEAFCGCVSLANIVIPDSTTYIGMGAFMYCHMLTSVTFGKEMNFVENSAFWDCPRITKIEVAPKNTIYKSVDNCLIREADKSLILGCKNSVIPTDGSVTSIGDYAFRGCEFTSITIPNSITSIGWDAFDGCNSLENIYITDLAAWCNISGLGNLMTYGSSNKKVYLNNELITADLVIPDGVTSICDYAFYNCSGLTSITIPDSAASIGWSAFEGCSGLTSITIPDGVTSIGGYAFRGCSRLTNVTIGTGLTSIYMSGLFVDCCNLEKVVWNAENCLILTSSGESMFKNCNKLTQVIIGTNVKTIPTWAFSGCSGLTSIIIPDSVTSIGWSAFEGCSGLKNITIPDSITSIDYSTFGGCSELEKVYYQGTSEQWSDILIASDNDYLISATRYYYSETRPTIDGNFWHCDENGDIVEW